MMMSDSDKLFILIYDAQIPQTVISERDENNRLIELRVTP